MMGLAAGDPSRARRGRPGTGVSGWVERRLARSRSGYRNALDRSISHPWLFGATMLAALALAVRAVQGGAARTAPTEDWMEWWNGMAWLDCNGMEGMAWMALNGWPADWKGWSGRANME